MTAVERERLVNQLELAPGQLQVSGTRIFRGMLGLEAFGNRKERGTPNQEA